MIHIHSIQCQNKNDTIARHGQDFNDLFLSCTYLHIRINAIKFVL